MATPRKKHQSGRRSAAPALEPKSFEALVRGVEQTYLEGRRRIEWTAVFSDWDTGRQINEHVLLNRDRAGYAESVIIRLAARTGIKERALYYCARFHRCFPILSRGSKLTSRHYRYLADVFIETKSGAIIFLNNALLENGHAERSDGSLFTV